MKNKNGFIQLIIIIVVIAFVGIGSFLGYKYLQPTTNKVGLWKDCNPSTNNCESGLECKLYTKNIYRCIKYLNEDDECGISIAESCDKDLVCANTDKTRTRCGTFTDEGGKECFIEPLRVCANWKLFKGEGYSFKYPNEWIASGIQVLGGSSVLEIKDPKNDYSFNFTQRINYNQATGKEYENFVEYFNMESLKNRTIKVDGQEGVKVLPRAGSENVNSVYFFSKDKKAILSLELVTSAKDEQSIAEGQKLFDQILSTFKFL